MTEIVVLHHANCHDGFCAAKLMRDFLTDENVEFIPVQYGDPSPDVAGKITLILDFSYKRDVLERMNKQAVKLTVLDHHKSAEKELQGLSYCTFDMNHSGAWLTWDFITRKPNGTTPDAPWMVKYVEDRDLWRWKLPNSREINAAIRSYPLDFYIWDELEARDPESLIPEGKAILRAEGQIVADHVARAWTTDFFTEDGYDEIPCVNATTLFSEIAGELAEGSPFAVVWFVRPNKDGKLVRQWSLRSRDGVDVSEIAARHGGGGHAAAAGFETSE